MNEDRSAVLVDPTAEDRPPARRPLDRPASLDGVTVGLLDIAKERGDVFIDRLAEHLDGRGIAVRRYAKPTASRSAPAALAQTIVEECDVVVEALAD